MFFAIHTIPAIETRSIRPTAGRVGAGRGEGKVDEREEKLKVFVSALVGQIDLVLTRLFGQDLIALHINVVDLGAEDGGTAIMAGNKAATANPEAIKAGLDRGSTFLGDVIEAKNITLQ